MSPALADRRAAAVAALRCAGGVVVALSGGVDSAVLLALAVEALGPERVLAATGRSASVPEHDVADASRVAAALGVGHEIVATDELSRAGYRANAGDRCFHCRSELFDLLLDLAARRGLAAVAYGAIVDDVGDLRPGMRAAEARGILAPLLEAGLGKDDVRELARALELVVSEKPAAACLASRIPVGVEVTPGRLDQVGRAEAVLRGLGFAQFRVRHHGEVARLELDDEGERRLADPGVRGALVAGVTAAGFRFVTVDLSGYRRGSLNPLSGGPGPGDPDRTGGQ